MNFKGALKRKVADGKQYHPEIDGMRFVAIMTVLLYHIFEYFSVKNNIEFSGLLYLPFQNGAQGVQLFFVISGFILTLPFASKYPKKQAVDIKSFFLRRVTRLEPPYIISLVIFFLVLVYRNPQSLIDLTEHLMASIFYIHNIVYGKGSDINTVAWSLEVEIQFYLLMPILAQTFKLSKLNRRCILLFLFLVSVAVNFSYEIYFRTLFAQFHYFLLGMIIADIFVSKDFKTIRSGFLGFLGLFIILFVNRENGNWHESIFIIGCFVFFCSVVFNPAWKRIFSFNVFAIIGGMCYSIYLLHYPIISFFGTYANNLLKPTSSYLWLYFLFLVPIVLIISSVFYLLIEKPCMDNTWPNKLTSWVKKIKF